MIQKKNIQVGTVFGPYSPGLEVSLSNQKMLFISGQIPVDVNGNIVSEHFPEQAEQVFQNLKAVLEKAEYLITDVVKITIYLTDLANFASINEACKIHFVEPFPARATIQVSALPKGALVEIEAVAMK